MEIHGHAVFPVVMKLIQHHLTTILCLPLVKLIIQHKETIKYCLLFEGEMDS